MQRHPLSPFRLLPLALAALGYSATAQQLPSAGGQLQQIPPAPVPPRAAPQISIVPGTSPATTSADGARILIKAVRISGATAYAENELLALTGFKPGTELTLADLRAMAARIAERLRSDGYFLAQAYLPAQDVNDGVVTIAVLEGRYGQVVLRNETRLSDALINAELAGLDRGTAITMAPLESRLLLLSDIPGVTVSSTLVPGASVGASDLVVDVKPGQGITGSIDADNAGNRYTGIYRAGATLNLNNPTGQGDVASLRALTSGSGLNYARASYQTRLGRVTAGLAYSRLHYALGREFKGLRASGDAGIASIYASTPLVRSRSSNLYAQVAFDAKTFSDRVDSASTVSDKKAQVLMASLRGDHADTIGRGGSTSFSATGSVGNIDIGSAAMRAQDAATARSNGRFEKVAFNVARLQTVSDSVSVYAALTGQIASKNLDVSEKMELGGVDGVRAYPEGEAYGDRGYLLAVEARWRLPAFSSEQPGQLQLVGFVDAGRVTLNQTPWAPGTNRRTLTGAGVGLNWVGYQNVVVRFSYARRLGDEPAQSAPDRSGRVWLQVIKYF